jgi:hypothetical protein
VIRKPPKERARYWVMVGDSGMELPRESIGLYTLGFNLFFLGLSCEKCPGSHGAHDRLDKGWSCVQ